MHASILLLLALAAQAAAPTHGSGANPVGPRDVRATLVPEKASVFLGEPISAELVVKNLSAGPLSIENTQDLDLAQFIASQKTIQLAAVDEKGDAAPPPAWRRPSEGWMGGSSFGGRQIPPGGSTRLRFDIAPLVAFAHPGTYTLTATAALLFYGEGRSWTRVPVKAAATLEVLPPDAERMGRLIDELEKKSTTGRFARVDEEARQEEDAQSEAERKLSYVTDERVIPFYRLRMRHAERGDGIADALAALSKFRGNDALDSLKDGLEITEFVNPYSHKPDAGELERIHMEAARSLLYSPHPGAIPLLLANRDHPDPQVRCIVIEALGSGKVPPAQAIPILRHMAKDKVGFVADRAKWTLKNPAAKQAP